ncbi:MULTISPECIES: toast rack family protein [Bacillus]|uniref:toast rack family protein n=1 Tax=Bacillus TaxID=1386 RepID=UPI000318C5D6|nr:MULTISPECIES: toast rack family protein [Bacillus]
MKRSIFIGAAAGLLLILTSCSIPFIGDEKEESILVEKDKAKQLDVELKVGVGELAISNGTDEWVEGNVKHNVKKLEPVVSYDKRGNKGAIVIEQKDIKFPKVGNIKNKWDIRLTNEVPMILSVNAGASISKLDLQGLKLKQLDIEAGVGDLTVDLGGKWEKNFDANIKTGVGEAVVILPSKVGVKITCDKGVGKIRAQDLISKGNGVYVNKAYEDADVTLDVNVEMGVGEVTFKVD